MWSHPARLAVRASGPTPGATSSCFCCRGALADADRSYLRLPALPPRIRIDSETARRSGEFLSRLPKWPRI